MRARGLMLMLLLLLLAGAVVAWSRWELRGEPGESFLPEPRVLACGGEGRPPDLLPEVREAAQQAVVWEILQKSLEVNLFADHPRNRLELSPEDLEARAAELQGWIEFLETLAATGPNRHCRSIAVPLLPWMYLSSAWLQFAREHGPLEEEPSWETLAALLERMTRLLLEASARWTRSVWQAESFELASSRTLTLGYSLLVPLIFVPPLLAPELWQDLVPLFEADKWERVACGGRERFTVMEVELEFDGSLFIQNNDSQGFPFREVAARLWTLSILLGELRGDVLPEEEQSRILRGKAVSGCTPELRKQAAETYVQLVEYDPARDEEERALLEELARHGESRELRVSAGSRLARPLAEDASWDDLALQELAFFGETEGIRLAAGEALGLRWWKRVEQGQLDLITSFPFLGADGKTVRQGTLLQFVAAHTGAHPELARAAVAPLTELLRTSINNADSDG